MFINVAFVLQVQIISSLSLSFSFNREQAHNVECGPCLHDNEKVRATHFCKTCADPEPFCKTCAKQHTRQKTFKDHTICENIREFLEHQSIQRY